jgi:hypothetical protein
MYAKQGLAAALTVLAITVAAPTATSALPVPRAAATHADASAVVQVHWRGGWRGRYWGYRYYRPYHFYRPYHYYRPYYRFYRPYYYYRPRACCAPRYYYRPHCYRGW